MILGQRIRLDLNNVQRTFMARCAGTSRFTYNWGLARWQERYEAGKKPSWMGLNKELNAIKGTEFPWMVDLPWAVTNKALADLGTAFTNFFRRVKAGQKPGYPRFKKRGRCREGFTLEGRAIQFDGKLIKIPKLGWVRTRQELRWPEGRVLSTRFSERAGHWYASVQVEVADTWVYPHRCTTDTAVGVDLGVHDLAVLSDGTKIAAPRALRTHGIQLRRLNKELHRRTKGGKNRAKTKAKLARLHERISNVRKDCTHKLTTMICKNHAIIGVETLNVAGMKRGLRLGKSVSDAGMGEVLRQIDYKAALSGSTLVKADRWYPGTKSCSACGVINPLVVLGVQEWTCPCCDSVHDRDVNAAINLRDMAVAQTATACRQGSAGLGREIQAKLPLGQESSSRVNR